MNMPLNKTLISPLEKRVIYNFETYLQQRGVQLKRSNLHTLQVNIGKKCNQACRHCHVDAGPKRTEMMELKTIERVLWLLKNSDNIKTLDLTGGAPELNPHFRYLAAEARKLDKQVIDRCNLTILFEAGQESTAEFLAQNHIEVIASLPCYIESNVDKQRGHGVFNKSIRALRILNDLGYGKNDSKLVLNLVYNPIGPVLPPSQLSLEKDYKKELKERFNIIFNHLFTITNMPIKKFAKQLWSNGQFEDYMSLLLQSFNADTINGLMCRNQLSVDWKGNFYDCDFNQVDDIPVPGEQRTLWDIDSLENYKTKQTATTFHCFGCTAGSGSSCGGSLA